MRCRDLASRAAGLAALAHDDPERRTAEAHARGCAACSATLTEAAAVLELLGAGAPSSAPDAPALARAGRAIRAAVAAERRDRGGWLLGGLAALTALVLVSWELPAGSAGVAYGLHCMFLELGGALGLLVAGLVTARRYLTPGTAVAAAGMGALAVQGFVTHGCNAATLSHDLAFHTAPVLGALALTALVALRFSKNPD